MPREVDRGELDIMIADMPMRRLPPQKQPSPENWGSIRSVKNSL